MKATKTTKTTKIADVCEWLRAEYIQTGAYVVISMAVCLICIVGLAIYSLVGDITPGTGTVIYYSSTSYSTGARIVSVPTSTRIGRK